MNSGVGGTLGSYRSKKRRHGSLVQTQDVVGSISGGIIGSAVQNAVFLVLAAISPPVGAAVFAGFLLYRFGKEALQVKRDYDAGTGSPEDRAVSAAIREGVRVGVGMIMERAVGSTIDSLAQKTAYTTSDILDSNGTFERVVRGINLPLSTSEDLRDFYVTALERALVGAYSGAQGEIEDYIAERIG